jgi:short-subunit dehydrogenase
MLVKDKVIIVTGAGSGMGRELTLQLFAKSAHVALVDINNEAMQETIALSTHVTSYSIHQVNIADRTAVEAFAEAVLAHHGKVDGIINNAGIIQPFVKVADLTYEQIQRIMDVNFYGTVYMVKTFLPHLLKRPEAHIVNISSMGGFIPFPGQTIYSASKAAVKMLTEGLYAELKDTSVKVTVIHPGAINTNIMSNSGLQTKQEESASKNESNMTMPANEAATAIIEAMESDKFRAMVGKDASLLDKFYRVNPRKALDFIVKKMSNRG